MACADLECLHAAIRRIISLAQQTWAPEWIDLNAQFTVDRANKLHAKNAHVGAVVENLSLGVSSSTTDEVDVGDGQGNQADPDSAAIGTPSVLKKPAARAKAPREKTFGKRGPWRQFIGEKSRGGHVLADTRSISAEYHALSEEAFTQLQTDADIASERQKTGDKDYALGTTRDLMRNAKRQKMDELVNEIKEEAQTNPTCDSLVAAGSVNPKGKEQFQRRIALEVMPKKIRIGMPLEEALTTAREVERASSIVAASLRKERHDIVVQWHKTNGRAMVNSFLESFPLFGNHRGQLVPIPDRNVNCFLVSQDVKAVATTSSNAQASSTHLSLHSALGGSFAGRCQAILDKDLKRMDTSKVGGPPRPCLKKLVCLCTGQGIVLWEFANRFKRAIKMQYDRQRPTLLRPLLQKMIVFELVGSRPVSTSPVAIVRARREQNIDLTVPYETHAFFHIAHMRLSPYEPLLRKMNPMYDDPDYNEKHVKAVTRLRGGRERSGAEKSKCGQGCDAS